MSRSVTDSRQVIIRRLLTNLAGKANFDGTSDAKPASTTELDNLLDSLDLETTSPLRLDASATPDLIVSVGAALIANTETGRNKSIPHIGSLLPNDFAAGTITFPSSPTGNITNSTNANTVALNVTVSNYIKVLIYMDALGELSVLPGVENAVEADATVLPAPNNTLAIGYVTLFNNAGTIDNVVQAKIFQFGVGGGSGSGGGDGVLEPAPGFQALEVDDFSELPSSSDTKVDSSTTATHSVADSMFELKCDKSKTVTTTGINYTLSGAPTGFTLAIGDIVWDNAQAIYRRVATVLTGTTGTLDAIFPVDLAASAGMLSQAVHTKDLVNLGDAAQKTRPRDFFSGNVSPIVVDYQDSLVAGDAVADFVDEARVVVSASNDGAVDDAGVPDSNLFESIFTRPNAPDQIDNYVLPVTGSPEVVESNTTTGTAVWGMVQVGSRAAQTFVWNSSKFLDSVRIKMSKSDTGNGFPTGTVNLKIRATSGNLPSGSDLFTSNSLNVSDITSSFQNVLFEFPGGTTLTEGVQYAFYVDSSNVIFPGGGALVSVERSDVTDFYPPGQFSASVDSGASWFTSGVNSDMLFEVFGVSLKERLHQTFFCNPDNVSVTTQANLLRYETSFFDEPTIESGGVLQSAFCMSDGSGTEIQCLAPTIVSSKTRFNLDPSSGWTYVPGVNAGETKGQLSVFVDGLEIPRFVSGATTDAYYIEIDSSTIEFHTDLSSTPLSISVYKDTSVVDTNNQNTTHINAMDGIFVGSQAQVDANVATYATIQAAIDGANAGDVITILAGTFTENLTIDKSVMIKGVGRKTVISGTIDFNTGSDFSSLRMVRVTDDITINTDGSFLNEMWLATAKSISDLGTGNSVNVVGE